MEYLLLEADNAYSLSEKVQGKLNNGWLMYSNPAVCVATVIDDENNTQLRFTYIQAVVKPNGQNNTVES